MNQQRLVAAIIAVILAVTGVTIALVDDDQDGRSDHVVVPLPAIPVAVGVDGADKDRKPDDVLVLDREAREVAQNAQRTPDRYDLSGDLRGRDKTPVGQTEGPLATPEFPGCQTRFLPTNFSNRVSSVRAFAVHYTAGLNRPGLSDMNGLTAFASSPSAGVSWHFLIDAEGHCYYSVPLNKKAWTIGNLNSQTVNVEVIGTGREPHFPAGSAGAAKLKSVATRVAKIYGFPVRLGALSNCNVTTPGIVTHWMGGACSGGHIDIRPYSLQALVDSWRVPATKPPSSKAIAKCKTLVRVRRLNRPPDPPVSTQPQRELAAAAKRQLARSYVCGEHNGRMHVTRR